MQNGNLHISRDQQAFSLYLTFFLGSAIFTSHLYIYFSIFYPLHSFSFSFPLTTFHSTNTGIFPHFFGEGWPSCITGTQLSYYLVQWLKLNFEFWTVDWAVQWMVMVIHALQAPTLKIKKTKLFREWQK